MDIKQLIGETTDYDKKVALETKKPKSWCKSISAFANCYGGKLVFGVANDDALVGLSDAEEDAEKISEIIKTHLNPIPEFNLSFEKDNDKTSEKFWELEKRIKEDKRHPGVVMELKKSEVIWDIVRFIRLKVITYNDLSDFSDELQNEVKRILEMSR